MDLNNLAEKDRVIFETAREDFQEKHYYQAVKKIDFIQANYEPITELIMLEAACYFELKKVDTALELIQSLADLKVPTDFELKYLVKILLEEGILVQTRLALIANDQITSKEDWQSYESAENEGKKDNVLEYEMITKKLTYIGGENPDKQQMILQTSQKLPWQLFVKAAKRVLSDPIVWQVVKSHLLATLMDGKLDENIEFAWVDDNTYQINPKLLAESDYGASFAKLDYEVRQKWADKDPVIFENIETIISELSRNMFPFFDKIIKRPKEFLRAIEIEVLGLTGEESQAQLEPEMKWIKKLLAANQYFNF
ncbi:hypothetical protein [Lentilactobacillus sp. Marseille-Q4993]|uniref:hypothetical protein n=1 Tax=Lentilactobacillus sp. Marseille-Q4993 TaxID=3039492 RepID=UPI0024BD06A1|nr:hypothetical protein [Lentilactobacillus sp. Marseille-Q4993]